MNHSISELMIDAARALRSGAAEHIVALALQADGVAQERVETVIRWCKLFNQRNPQMKSIDEMRDKYPWEDNMGEVSGFGGAYEDACRTMIYSGLAWLEGNKCPDLEDTGTPDYKALEEAVASPEPGCSGAMHSAAMSHCLFISRNGWDKYVQEMKKRG